MVSTTQFGAFMEVLPGKDGLVHVSELAEVRTEKVEDDMKEVTHNLQMPRETLI